MNDNYQQPETWENYGDANPDRHGGVWVRWDGGEWEVIETRPLADMDPDRDVDDPGQFVRFLDVQPQDIFVDGDPSKGYTDDAQYVVDTLSGANEIPEGLAVDGRVGWFVAAFATSGRHGSHGHRERELESWDDYWQMLESFGVDPDAEE